MGVIKTKKRIEIEKECEGRVKHRLENTTQQYLDSGAKDLGYKDILTLCSYALSTKLSYQKEGQAGLVWRDDVWDVFYSFKVTSETTEEQLLDKLPKLKQYINKDINKDG